MDLLRFITAGSVDDGKSTLIGRLLYDSKNIMVDQLEAMERSTRSRQAEGIDLALLTDGLRAEREQGITIDVAYKYFNTPNRKFIIADAPGHIQYTRNMVTGASNANLIIILVDARHGISEQTRRHSIIAWLLQIPHVILAVNKMDLVDNAEEVYNAIVLDYAPLAERLGLKDVRSIPISALNGDNIVDRSANLDWYRGETLLEMLENVEITSDINLSISRMPVQYVIRPQSAADPDYRGYAGKITSGWYQVGQEIEVLPARLKSRITAIELAGQEVLEAVAPQNVIISLADDLDISRGDVLVIPDEVGRLEQEFTALTCWMDHKPLVAGGKFLLQLHSRQVKCLVKSINYRLDVNTLDEIPAPASAGLNDVVSLTIRTASPLPFDSYTRLRSNGGAILIDETSYLTVAACMLQ